ncbi:MAG TPA: DUF1203 domain-containing protein [Caulobacteraceae bacterium]|jgi:hypothetical protein
MFRVIALDPEPFDPLFDLSEADLAARGARRLSAGENWPCRVSLDEAQPGEPVLLMNHQHQPADTPYRSSHAIFVTRRTQPGRPGPGVVPPALARRPLSVRAFDPDHMMIDADLTPGEDAAALFERLLADPRAAYLQAHYARRGCYAARVERA